MTEIVKVQRPLMTNGQGQPLWLIYDRDRKHVTQVPEMAIPSHVRKAMGDRHKAFFVGAWSSVVGWGLSEITKNQDW